MALHASPLALVFVAFVEIAACGLGSFDRRRGDLDAQSRDVPLEVRFTERFRIGGASAPAWAAFEDTLLHIGFDARGRLYVLDQRAARITVVDDSGRLVRTMGRPGSGPGELAAPRTMAVGSDGTVYVGEALSRAIVLFDSSGQWVRALSVRPGLASLASAPNGVVGAPPVFTVDGEHKVMRPGGLSDAPELPLLQVVAAQRAGEADRVVTVSHASLMPVPRPPSRLGVHLLGPRPHWAAFRDGALIIADSVGYQARVVDLQGRVITRISRPIAPRKVTTADRDRALKRREAQVITPDGRLRGGRTVFGNGEPVTGSQARAMADAVLAAVTYADVVPSIERIATDWSDRAWIWRSVEASGRPGPVDFFARDGRYLGSATMPPNFAPRAFGPGGLIASIVTDEDGIPVVVVERIAINQ